MKKMKKKLIVTTTLLAGAVLTANAFAADDLDGLFGDADTGTTTSTTTTTTGTTTNNDNTDDLFGGTTTTDNTATNTNTTTQNQDNNSTTTDETKLEELKYYTGEDNVSFVVDYLPNKSNFVVEFTGNRTNPITLTGVEIQDLSGKVIDLGGLAEKISFITAGNDVKKITFAELNQLAKNKNSEGFAINPKDKVYIQGEFNNIDKQVLATLLNNQTKFKVIVKGKNIKELIPTKEGTMTNNTTLTVDYLFKYVVGEQPKQEEVKDKTVEKVKKKDTGPVETSLAFLLFVMAIMTYVYIKNGSEAKE